FRSRLKACEVVSLEDRATSRPRMSISSLPARPAAPVSRWNRHALHGGARARSLSSSDDGGVKEKTPTCFQIGVSYLKLDDDLLSHGEAPHYHRRCIVSLLSSEWDQVVPMLYGRQAIRLLRGC